MKLIVTYRELQYAGRTYLRGEAFEASPKHARILTLIRKAEYAVDKPVRALATMTAPPAAREAETGTAAVESEAAPTEIPHPAETEPVVANETEVELPLESLSRLKLIALAKKRGVAVEADDNRDELVKKLTRGVYGRRDMRAKD